LKKKQKSQIINHQNASLYNILMKNGQSLTWVVKSNNIAVYKSTLIRRYIY